jgi:CHAT domain-containing protein/tetratricopeptide (TPR) repeat protein
MRAQASSLFASVILLLAIVCLCASGQNLFWASQQNHLKTFTSAGGGKPYAFQDNVAAQVEQAFHLRQSLNVQNLNSAIRLFEKSASQYWRSGAALKAAEAEREAGDTYLMMGRYRPALNAYTRALNWAGRERKAGCTIWAHMARAFANQGDIPQAEHYADATFACPIGPSNPRMQADILEAKGETYFWGGKRKEAIDPLSQARDLFSRAGDHDGEALSLLMLANSKAGLKDDSSRQAAPQHAREALRLWTAAGNRYGMARAQAVLAFIAVTAGQFDLARCNSDQAFSVFHQMGDKDDEAIILNIQGRWARDIGDAQTALDYYGKARTAFATVGDRGGEIEAITGINTAWRDLGQYQKLPSLYAQKLRLVQKTDHVALTASGLMDRAGIQQARRQYDEAGRLYFQALEKYRSADHAYGEGDAFLRLAYLSIARGQDDQAIEFLENARQLKKKTGQIETVARIQYELARIYRRRRQLEDSRTEILEAIHTIESQRLMLSTPDSRAQYFASVHQYYSLYIQVLMELHSLHPDQGLMQRAFEASERSKVRSLLDLLQNSDQASSCSRLLENQLASERSPGSLPDTRGEDVGPAQTLTLQQLQANLLDDHTVLVEYALGDEASYVWAVDRKNIAAYKLPSEEQVRKLTLEFRKDMIPLEPRADEPATQYAERESTAKRGRELRAQKLTKILIGTLPLKPGQRILIVPDGPLQYIPFSALPLTGVGKKGLFFLEQHEIIAVPSASALLAIRLRPRAAATAGIAIFADPIFEREQKSSGETGQHIDKSSENQQALARALRDVRPSQHIDKLPGSRTEAEAIQKVFGAGPTLMALGFEANRNAVLDGRLSAFRLIHFATHGIIDVRHPEMSGLILSLVNAKGQRQDGYLRLGDIYQLKLSADLVVLSSCESALGKELQAEGIIGLPRGFLHAGAKSVIASLWKVDDAASAVLMKELYTFVQQGKSPSAALREAQLALIKANNHYSMPYYWAAFVLEGDYK